MASEVATPRRLHPLTPLVDLLGVGPQALVAAFLGTLGGGLGLVVVLLVPAAVLVAARVVRWARFTYVIDDGVLRIEQGLLTRRRRELRLERIQQVDVVAKLRHRALGVVALHIDAAGGGAGAEVVLDVVSEAEADRLRQALASYGAEAAQPPDPAAHAATATARPSGLSGEPLVAVPIGELALAGMTGGKALVLIAVVAQLADLVGDVPRAIVDRATDAVPRGPLAVTVAALAVVAVWIGLAAAWSIVTDFGFTMTTTGRDVHVRRGLLEQREATIPLHRIQAVRIQRTLLRRLLGRSTVVVQSATAGGGQDAATTRVTIPIVRDGDVARILAVLVPGASPVGPLVTAPPAARRRALIRYVVPSAIAAALAAVALWPLGAVALVTVPAAVVVAYDAYRALGHAIADGYVVAREGAIQRDLVIVPIAKAQSARVRTSPLQRRSALATLFVEVAGRGRTPRVHDADARRVAALHRQVLASPAARRDEVAARRLATARR